MKRALGLYLMLAMGAAAHAAAEPQVFKLFYAKQWVQAQELAQRFAQKHPSDGQAAFVLGVALMYTDQLQQARDIFLALEKKYPLMAALQNNLGVVALVQGDQMQAEKYFRAALSIDPGHTNAQRNMANIRSKATMDAAHVDKRGLEFLGLASATPSNTLEQPSQRRADMPMAAKPQAKEVQNPKPTDVDRPLVASKPLATVPSKSSPKTDKAEPMVSTFKGLVPASRISLGPTGKEVPHKSGTNPFNEDIKRQVFDALNAWLTAWAAQDVQAYLAMYSDDFEPGDGLSKAQWQEQRNQRISAPAQIRIDAVDVVLEVGSPVAVVATFQQHYRAGRLNEVSNKMLVFIRDSEKTTQWKIADERTSY